MDDQSSMAEGLPGGLPQLGGQLDEITTAVDALVDLLRKMLVEIPYGQLTDIERRSFFLPRSARDQLLQMMREYDSNLRMLGSKLEGIRDELRRMRSMLQSSSLTISDHRRESRRILAVRESSADHMLLEQHQQKIRCGNYCASLGMTVGSLKIDC